MANLESGFEILRYSDAAFEKMTIEIDYRGEEIAQINMDNGLDNLEIEFFTEFVDSKFVSKFPLADLLQAIESAKEALAEY